MKPAYDASTAADRSYRLFGEQADGRPWGHVDLLIGREAPARVWPLIADWLDAR